MQLGVWHVASFLSTDDVCSSWLFCFHPDFRQIDGDNTKKWWVFEGWKTDHLNEGISLFLSIERYWGGIKRHWLCSVIFGMNLGSSVTYVMLKC